MAAESKAHAPAVEAVVRTASLSKCGKFLYRLGRRWAEGPMVLYVMLHAPSTDHQQDDTALCRCIRFAQAEGFGALEMVFLFAFRASCPAHLKAYGFPVGPDNDRYLVETARQAERVCVAWGAQQDAQPRVQVVMPLIRSTGLEPYCLGITRSGFPAHPGRLAARSRMFPFTVEAIQAAMEGRQLEREELASTPAQIPQGSLRNRACAWPFPFSAHEERTP